jgi:hypothetical protein
LGGLTHTEFVVTLHGVVMYTGHFCSMASSTLPFGVIIFDTLGLRRDELLLTFTQAVGESGADPRERAEIAEHFRAAGKLQEEK